MALFRSLGSFVIILLVFSGCKTKQKAIEENDENAEVITTGNKISTDAPDSLWQLIKDSDTKLSWFSAKVSVKSEIENQSNSFNANLRVKVDSSIWMSISPALGIEVARVLITRDSLKFLNRLSATYFEGDYLYLKNLLQIDVNFEMIQAILLGNSYLHYTVENYISDKDNHGLILSTLKKRKIKKETELNIPEVLTQELWFSYDNKKIRKMEMQDYRPVRKFMVDYLSFLIEDGKVMPEHFYVQAQAEKQVKIDLKYSKITVSKELNLPFSIPKHYELYTK